MIFIRKTGVIYIFGDTPDSRDVIRQFAQKPSSSRARRTSRTWKSCLICSRTTRTCRTPTTTGRPRTKPYIARVSAVLGNRSVVIYDALTAIYITTSAAIYSGGCFFFSAPHGAPRRKRHHSYYSNNFYSYYPCYYHYNGNPVHAFKASSPL